MEQLAECGRYKYVKLSSPDEVDQFKVDETSGKRLTFLKELGITSYRENFKIWLRKFPRPIVIFCLDDRDLVGWVYVEEWPTSAKDGEPVYVLRGIEIQKERRSMKMGFRLLILSARETPGYLITKPINPGARRFFLDNHFVDKEVFPRAPLDLQGYPGYLILPPFKKADLLENTDYYFD